MKGKRKVEWISCLKLCHSPSTVIGMLPLWLYISTFTLFLEHFKNNHQIFCHFICNYLSVSSLTEKAFERDGSTVPLWHSTKSATFLLCLWTPCLYLVFPRCLRNALWQSVGPNQDINAVCTVHVVDVSLKFKIFELFLLHLFAF